MHPKKLAVLVVVVASLLVPSTAVAAGPGTAYDSAAPADATTISVPYQAFSFTPVACPAEIECYSSTPTLVINNNRAVGAEGELSDEDYKTSWSGTTEGAPAGTMVNSSALPPGTYHWQFQWTYYSADSVRHTGTTPIRTLVVKDDLKGVTNRLGSFFWFRTKPALNSIYYHVNWTGNAPSYTITTKFQVRVKVRRTFTWKTVGTHVKKDQYSQVGTFVNGVYTPAKANSMFTSWDYGRSFFRCGTYTVRVVSTVAGAGIQRAFTSPSRTTRCSAGGRIANFTGRNN